MLNWFRKKGKGTVSLEEQIAILKICGIDLAHNVSPDALTLSSTRERLEAEPFTRLLIVMGGPAEVESQAGAFRLPLGQYLAFRH